MIQQTAAHVAKRSHSREVDDSVFQGGPSYIVPLDFGASRIGPHENSQVGQQRAGRADGRAALPRHGPQYVLPGLVEDRRVYSGLTGVGYPTVLGMYLFTVGTKMTFRAAPRMLLRGGGILAAKVGTATALRPGDRAITSAATCSG